ncbi:helix-turn-helix domain-containing protein [Streptomyces sp. HUAS TT7]|uniref:helix-turn-helix domain-containing protein n=1 Tax=Streptomyces sp. HUAS TT7 TaxID=3447507 RepID=UPI003F657D60
MTNRKMMTIDDVADYLTKPKHWVYDNHSRLNMPFKKIGQALRIRPADLDKWVDAQQ